VHAVTNDPPASALWRAVAVAKSCAGHASEVVVRNAHQVHGAIGTTAEHGLHRLTMPLLAWRSEYGSTRYWDEELGAGVLRAGPSTWSWVIGTQDADDSQRSSHEN
jgi:acyl-CoA dehydrogenase